MNLGAGAKKSWEPELKKSWEPELKKVQRVNLFKCTVGVGKPKAIQNWNIFMFCFLMVPFLNVGNYFAFAFPFEFEVMLT